MTTDKSPSPFSTQVELEHRILLGLRCEWKAAWEDLPRSYQQQLTPPLFRLADLKTTWGQWSTTRQEIVISRRLVHHHPWDAVREVLHHEMAHQLAARILDGTPEPPHGACFHQACRLLNANPRASDHYSTLDERLIQDTSADPRDRLMARIGKLLALAAGSPNPKEATAAMLKAQELMDKYNLDLIEGHTPPGYISIFLGHPALRHSRDRYHLAHLILSHYWVEGLWIPAYVVEKGKMGRVLEISGTPTNVQTASYAYDYIQRYIRAQWSAYNRHKRLNHHRRIDFAVGIIDGFHNKLAEHRLPGNATSPPNALATRNDPHLTAYMDRRYPRTQSIRRPARQTDVRVLADGIESGRRLVIAKAIETHGKGPAKALPGPS